MDDFDSLDRLAKPVPATSLDPIKEKKLDTNYFSQCIESALPTELKKYYDQGHNYFKISGNDSLSF